MGNNTFLSHKIYFIWHSSTFLLPLETTDVYNDSLNVKKADDFFNSNNPWLISEHFNKLNVILIIFNVLVFSTIVPKVKKDWKNK